MVSVKPLKPHNEWIPYSYKTALLLHQKCLMRDLENHTSTRGNMPNMDSPRS